VAAGCAVLRPSLFETHDLPPVNRTCRGGTRLQSQPKKVLVVENDEVVLVLVSHILTSHSYVVHAQRDLADVDGLLQHNDYSALLVDIKGPKGSEFIRKIEAHHPALLPRLIISTSGPHDARAISELPVHSVMKKPFELYELLDAVNEASGRA
jgi:DNA-binding response OmpR family regulator